MILGRTNSFRRWLFDRVLGTLWATKSMTDAQIARIAPELGLDPQFLLEVRAEARIRRNKRGFRGQLHENRMLYQYHLFMPEVVWRDWQKECEFRGVKGALLLRSLIHDYLLGSREPLAAGAWYWRGKRYKMGEKERNRFLERAAMPHGARRALRTRAEWIGTTPTAVARALVIEAMSGLHRDVPLVETGMMFDDERRYLARFEGRLTGGAPAG